VVGQQSGKLPPVDQVLLFQGYEQRPRDVQFEVIACGTGNRLRKVIQSRTMVYEAMRARDASYKSSNTMRR